MFQNQKTTLKMPKDWKPAWWLFNLETQTLGRAATKIADILRGKHRPYYTPSVDNGDFVVVINAAKVKLTGKKWTDKIYYKHTGYPGGLKETSAEEMLAKHPEDLIVKAVKGMLPKNFLAQAMLKKLKVYSGADHPHKAQPLKEYDNSKN